MNKKIRLIYYIISLIFLTLLIGLLAYRINTRLNENLNRIKQNFEELKISTLSIYLARGSFDSQYFTTKTKSDFQNTKNMLLLAIYSRGEGIQYLLAKDKSYLLSPLGEDPAWRGGPEYRFSPLLEVKLSASFAPGTRRNLYIDGIYQRLDRTDLYPLLREALYLMLVYLLITAIFLVISVPGGKPKSAAFQTYTPSPTSATPTVPNTAAPPIIQPAPATVSPAPAAPTAPTATAPPISVAPAAPTAVAPAESPPEKDQPDLKPGTSRSKLFTPETGLGFQEHFAQRLGFELERAASFDQDLSLVLITLDYQPRSSNRQLINQRLAQLIQEVFLFKDLAFEYGETTYAVILPDKDLDQAIKETSHYKIRLDSSSWIQGITISIGISARNGRLISGDTLLLETKQSLEQAVSGGGNQIVAFRADPEKFRRILTSTPATELN